MVETCTTRLATQLRSSQNYSVEKSISISKGFYSVNRLKIIVAYFLCKRGERARNLAMHDLSIVSQNYVQTVILLAFVSSLSARLLFCIHLAAIVNLQNCSLIFLSTLFWFTVHWPSVMHYLVPPISTYPDLFPYFCWLFLSPFWFPSQRLFLYFLSLPVLHCSLHKPFF